MTTRSPWPVGGGGGTISGTVNVQDNLNPSALNAPTANAVNTGLSTAQSAAVAAAAAAVAAQKGAASGLASLDGAGKVPSGQLPSYVDDVVEVANFAALPGTGETGKIYVTLSDNLQFRWGGSVYVQVGGPGSSDFGAGDPTLSTTRAADVPVGAKQSIQVNRYIGFSNAFAAVMEAFSASMPKNLRVTTPNSAEQGTILIPEGAGDLERSILVDVSGAAVSRHGLSIIGQGRTSSILRVPAAGSPANFRADGSWRNLQFKSDGGGKFEFVHLSRFGLVNYATQGGDGSTRLTDPAITLDLEYLVNLSFDDIYLYARSFGPRTLNQYSMRLRRNYNQRGGTVNVRHFPVPAAGPALNGTSQAAWAGTGVLLEENNAGVIAQLNAGQVHRMVHVRKSTGEAILNLSGEQIVQGIVFDDGARANHVLAGRLEWYVGSNGQEALSPTEYSVAKFTATTRDNVVRLAWSPSVPNAKGWIDESATQSNRCENAAMRTQVSVRNLLSSAGWSNSAGMSTASDARLPPGKPADASTKLTSNGSYNTDRYQVVTLNPDCGSVTAGGWYRRLTGDGIISPQIQSVINQPVTRGRLIDTDERFQTNSTIPLATSGHSWSAANGGELTLLTTRPPYVQAGVRLTAGGAYGTIASGASLHVRRITSGSVVLAQASDPGTITAPAALVVPSDMNTWQGAADITAEWQWLQASVPIRYNIVGLSLNGSNQPVLQMVNSSEVPPVGALVQVSGCADSRLNGVQHTIGAGDISGANLTISSVTAAGLDTSTVSEDSAIAHKGYLGLASLRYSQRTVTTSGTSLEWLAAAEVLVAGSHTLLPNTGPAATGGSSAWGGITGTLSAQADLQTALDAKLDEVPNVILLAGTALTLSATHSGAVIRCTSGSAVTITVPAAFNGMSCTVEQAGAGAVTFAASGTTLAGNLTLSGQGAVASLLPADSGTANTWRVVGQTGTTPIDPGTPRSITGAATLGASDINTTLRFNSASTAVLTLDTDAALGITGSKVGNSAIAVFIQGAGVPTFAAGGATILGTPRAGLAQNDTIVLNHTGIANTWSYA